jgi:hypothetical protein
MTTFHLPRTGMPELIFDGELRTEQIGTDTDDVTQGRVHDVRVYEADDGQFIVSVDYRSPFDSELSDNLVEAVDDLDGIDAVLSLYEAAERLDTTLFGERDTIRIQTVSSNLVDRFDRQVIATLNALAASHV